jgi:hypothetical protein
VYYGFIDGSSKRKHPLAYHKIAINFGIHGRLLKDVSMESKQIISCGRPLLTNSAELQTVRLLPRKKIIMQKYVTGPLSLVCTTVELLGRKSSGSGLENQE